MAQSQERSEAVLHPLAKGVLVAWERQNMIKCYSGKVGGIRGPTL